MTTAISRNAGLDTLRASAIALVFMYHYKVFVGPEPGFGWAGDLGWVGVDLFFVLSGYLIANQLFSGIAHGRKVSPTRFYARRALRTLPVFWLVLVAYFLWPSALGGRSPPPLWRFLSFTQNFGLAPGTAFSHAWSLCIEEQFYLVLPLLLAAGAALGRTRASGWLLMGALLALGVAARAALWRDYGRAGLEPGYMSHVYYATLCRIDEFLPGVAIAMVKHFHPGAWQGAMAHGRRFLIAGTLATAGLLAALGRWYHVDGEGYGVFMTVFGYSLIAAAFALLVVAALSPASALNRIRVPGAAALARWSYSIYLSHKPLAHLLHQAMAAHDLPASAQAVAITAACLGAGALLHRTVEAPFMAWRDRLVPTNFSTPASPLASAVPAKVPAGSPAA